MNKKILVTAMVVIMLLLGIAAVLIGIRLATLPSTTPLDGKAAPPSAEFTNNPCSGQCESGAECNAYGNPPVGKMWSCWYNNSVGAYRCAYDDYNSGGSSCYYDCSSGWLPCGCDWNACVDACLDKIGPGEDGTHTMPCNNCGQKFTCDCEKPEPSPTPTPIRTPTVTPTTPLTTTPTRPVTTTPTSPVTTTPTRPVTTTPTRPVTATPTLRPSETPTVTPTLPTTALISDKADMVLFGAMLMVLGIGFYRVGMFNLIEKFFWYFGGKAVLGKYNTKYFNEKITEEREDFEEKF